MSPEWALLFTAALTSVSAFVFSRLACWEQRAPTWDTPIGSRASDSAAILPSQPPACGHERGCLPFQSQLTSWEWHGT